MYTSFFGLNEKPFTITPDPRYLFMSERHGEGLAHLVYGVTESGGFIQLTGEVGTGKTTLVRTLLGQIPAEVDIALILNPQLTAVEFLTTICEELGLSLPQQRYSAKALVDVLNRHLLAAHAKGRRTILLIDEAQNLSEPVLEQLRLLTNLETARQKLLQIILIAQPELREKLAKDSMRQLAQRVTGRYHLEPLSSEEAYQYIDHRLRVAESLTEIFDAAAKKEVYRLSGGVPRIMNVICDRALLGAYSKETRKVSKRLVRKAASEVSGQPVHSGIVKWLLPALGVAAVAAISLFAWQNRDEPAEDETTIQVPIKQPQPAGDVQPGSSNNVPLASVFDDYEDAVGYQALLELWGVQYDPAAGTACSQAEAAGLRCFFQRGTVSTLRQLNRPVVMTVTTADGDNRELALTSLNVDEATVVAANGPVNVPLDELESSWFGQFMLLWRPANGNDDPIGPGMRNSNVRWLRESLATLDADWSPQGGDEDLFDEDLKLKLIEFQREHRLDADGLAGQKTQIIINTLLTGDETPRLTASR